MSYIEIIDEYKRYQVGDSVVAANNGVSFSIEKGEFVIRYLGHCDTHRQKKQCSFHSRFIHTHVGDF